MAETKDKFEIDLNTWREKVLRTYYTNKNKTEFSFVDTFSMINDIDKIIAEGFDHEPILCDSEGNLRLES